MACELQLLGAAIAIGFVHLIWAAAASTKQTGLAWNLGNRETAIPLTGMAARLQRAFANFRETFPFFAGLVVIAYLGGHLNGHTTYGAGAYVVGRALYLPLYAFGVPYARTGAWAISLLGMVAMAIGIIH